MSELRFHIRTNDVLAGLWWAPSVAFAIASGRAFSCGIDLRLRHARRLAAAGRHQAALRVYAAIRADVGVELRDARRRIRRLEQENEVLRRAAAYLSQANLPGKGSTRS